MEYDVVVIGGGITGAGILRDCALRGLKAVLVEKDRLGMATTAASTHLIHGGLRYLLYDRLTTHTTSWDAGNIMRIAQPLLTRLPILWPLYRDQRYGPEKVETLLKAYDAFQRMKGGLPHLRLSARAAAELAPGLRSEGLWGGVSFDEWWVDAPALVRRNAEAAARLGAEVLEETRVTALLRDGPRVRGVAVEGRGGVRELKGRVVVNAGGPWVARLGDLAGVRIPMRLRKGTHLVYDRPLVPVGLLLEAEDRERYVFVVPFPGGTLVGPTDLAGPRDPEDASAEEEEVRYLLASVRRYLPDFPGDYERTVTGLRPILGQAGSEKLLSREYEILDHEDAGAPGFLTAAGGKMSDFRLMAKDAVDLACAKLGVEAECRSHRVTLAGEPVTMIPDFPRPWRGLKRFLRRHPRLRELHALAYLAGGFLKHLAGRLLKGARETGASGFREHYGLK